MLAKVDEVLEMRMAKLHHRSQSLSKGLRADACWQGVQVMRTAEASREDVEDALLSALLVFEDGEMSTWSHQSASHI